MMNSFEKYQFPDVVLLNVFAYFTIPELAQLRKVCKRWNNIIRADSLWKKFIPKWPGFVPPLKPSAHRTVVKIWKSSQRICNENWFPNPLTELARYEKRLRKAEFHHYSWKNPRGSAILYSRLNPQYKLTTKGKDTEDNVMNQVCSEIWEKFKDSDAGFSYDISTHTAAMEKAKFLSRKEALEMVLQTYEPRWFLSGLDKYRYELNDNGDIKNLGPDYDDEEIEEDAVENDGVLELRDRNVSRRVHLGSVNDRMAWRDEVNKRLPVHLYRQIKTLFADNSEHFIVYYLNDGYFNENYDDLMPSFNHHGLTLRKLSEMCLPIITEPIAKPLVESLLLAGNSCTDVISSTSCDHVVVEDCLSPKFLDFVSEMTRQTELDANTKGCGYKEVLRQDALVALWRRYQPSFETQVLDILELTVVDHPELSIQKVKQLMVACQLTKACVEHVQLYETAVQLVYCFMYNVPNNPRLQDVLRAFKEVKHTDKDSITRTNYAH